MAINNSDVKRFESQRLTDVRRKLSGWYGECGH